MNLAICGVESLKMLEFCTPRLAGYAETVNQLKEVSYKIPLLYSFRGRS